MIPFYTHIPPRMQESLEERGFYVGMPTQAPSQQTQGGGGGEDEDGDGGSTKAETWNRRSFHTELSILRV